MKMKSRILALALFALVLVVMPARADLITFDDLTDNTIVTNQYAHVTFSAFGDERVKITTQAAYNGTKPNFICTGPVAGYIDCTENFVIEFDAAVQNVEFDALGNQTAVGGVFAKVDIYQNFVYTATFDMLVTQGNLDPDHQDLSAYSDITKLVFHSNTDGAGTGYDNLSFDAGVPVPEPASVLLVAVGLIGIGGLARKSRL